jgi:TRAP-type transport system small permease protein
MKRVLQRLQQVETGLCTFFLAVMTTVVIVQVFLRYLFDFSFAWAEELVRYVMIWMVMIGAALVQAKNDHIRIDFLPMLAGPRGRRVMETFFRLGILLFAVIILVKGIKMTYFNRLFESPGLRIQMWVPMLSLPLGAILITLYTSIALVQDAIRLWTWPVEKLREEDQALAREKFDDPAVSSETSLPHREGD